MRQIVDTQRNDPNDHYGTRHHKYTINIPLELMKQAQIKSKAAGFNEVAPYFRAILSREVLHGSLVLSDILGEKEVKRREIEVNLRREKMDNSKYSFVKIRIKKVFDLFNPRQYTLFN